MIIIIIILIKSEEPPTKYNSVETRMSGGGEWLVSRWGWFTQKVRIPVKLLLTALTYGLTLLAQTVMKYSVVYGSLEVQ